MTGENLVWQDEFDHLNESNWRHLVTAWRGGNKEFQYYRNDRRNSYVRDGVLFIKPTLVRDEKGNEFLYNGTYEDPQCNRSPCASLAGEDIVQPVFSARMISNTAFKYGRFEIRAKAPRGDWLWPAIWLLPKNWEYGEWPKSGEIDVLETRGNQNYTDQKGSSKGTDNLMCSLHYGPDGDHDALRTTQWDKTVATGRNLGQDFHIYGLQWTDHNMNFTLDGDLVGNIDAPEGGFWKLGSFDKNPGGTNIWENRNNMAPFDKEFQIILNVAVGGTFFFDDWINHPHPRPWNWNSSHPMKDFWEKRQWWEPTWHGEDTAMQIDYIRVYQ